MTHPAVSVIVTTYQRRDRLELCLAALYSQDYPGPLEIIVADDGSHDATATMACDQHETLLASLVRPASAPRGSRRMYYAWQEDRGFRLSAVRNLGARVSTGELLVFIDVDILLNPGAVSAYVDLYQHNPDRAIGGYYKYLKPMTITASDVQCRWDDLWAMRLPEYALDQGNVPVGMDVRDAWRGIEAIRPRPPDVFADPIVVFRSPFLLLGGNLMIPRHLWGRTTGFDEGIASYGGEDAELSVALADLGYGFSFSRAAGGVHMAHAKAQGATLEDEAEKRRYIARKYPRWFTADLEPAWDKPGWAWPEARHD